MLNTTFRRHPAYSTPDRGSVDETRQARASDKDSRESLQPAAGPAPDFSLPLPVHEVVLLLDQDGHILSAGAAQAGARLAELSFPVGGTLHSALHPDCDEQSCKLAAKWSRAWRAHQEGLAVQFVFGDRANEGQFNIRLQPIDYGCGAVLGDAISQYRDCSVVFIQDNTNINRSARSPDSVLALAGAVERAAAERLIEYRQRRPNDDAARAAAVRLIVAQESERRRIAAELHDSLGQTLSVLRFEIEACLGRAEQSGWNVPLLERSHEYVKRSLQELREIVRNLRPTVLDELGLTGALEQLCADFRAQCPDVELDYELAPTAYQLPGELATAIYRITQEALHNAALHASAERVLVVFALPNGGADLLVQDDGVGLPTVGEGYPGLGLVTMRERAETLGGSLQVGHTGRRGCSIRARWPAAAIEQLSQ